MGSDSLVRILMSRTYRRIAHARVNARRISYVRQRRKTYYWVQELKEEGFIPRGRDCKLTSRWYLNSWDDHKVSAYWEVEEVHHRTVEFLNEEYGEILNSTHRIKVWNQHDYEYHFKQIENDYVTKLKRISNRSIYRIGFRHRKKNCKTWL